MSNNVCGDKSVAQKLLIINYIELLYYYQQKIEIESILFLSSSFFSVLFFFSVGNENKKTYDYMNRARINNVQRQESILQV